MVCAVQLGLSQTDSTSWYENSYSPHYSPYISYGTSQENLSKYQDILSLVIVSFIPLFSLFEWLNKQWLSKEKFHFRHC